MLYSFHPCRVSLDRTMEVSTKGISTQNNSIPKKNNDSIIESTQNEHVIVDAIPENLPDNDDTATHFDRDIPKPRSESRSESINTALDRKQIFLLCFKQILILKQHVQQHLRIRLILDNDKWYSTTVGKRTGKVDGKYSNCWNIIFDSDESNRDENFDKDGHIWEPLCKTIFQ